MSIAKVVGRALIGAAAAFLFPTVIYAQEKPKEICDDGIDNDGDKKVDCDDPDCKCEPPKEICDDGVDNDGDKKVDCEDPDCKCEPPPSLCWMTGGGVKFESITRTWNAQNSNGQGGPKDSVGGVVYPSCSEFPSNGGNWNHVQHSQKFHLLGTDIVVLRCGNVPGIEPGTESPVCDVNFIEFVGEGRVQGIGGNHMDPIPAVFFGRVEDRNEPGNEQSANSGEDIDRYFLRVADANSGELIFIVDSDGVDDGAVDPLTITGGNFQIHCTSCGDGGGASFEYERVAYFLRGDANTDGATDVSDAIYSLSYLFGGGPAPRCLDAADANDDGWVDLGDPITTLGTVFLGTMSMAMPYPKSGHDAQLDGLDCALFEASF